MRLLSDIISQSCSCSDWLARRQQLSGRKRLGSGGGSCGGSSDAVGHCCAKVERSGLSACRHRQRRQARASARQADSSSAADVAVVGGGAAGLAAAFFAAQQGAQVTVLERQAEAGRKILISGGTRCNVLPADVDAGRDFFTESSPGAVRGMLASWPVDDCRTWLEGDIGLRLAMEDATRKWFPASNSSREVRDRLLAACTAAGVMVRYGAGLEGLQSVGDAGGWRCRLHDGSTFSARRVVMATGGKSYPKLGTDGGGWGVLQGLGHSLQPPYPALTPLKGSHPGGAQLSGLTVHGVQLAAKKASGRGRPALAQRGSLLFSHRGVTGPAVLDLSHHAVMALERHTPMPALTVNWTGDQEAAWAAALADNGGQAVGTVLHRRGLPTRLAEALCTAAGVDAKGTRAAELRKGQRQALLTALTSCPVDVAGHEGYMKAEVTGGGIPLNELNCATCESRKLPGVHICGELLDVFGRIGGFNFYWAFVTGRLAGLAAAAAG